LLNIIDVLDIKAQTIPLCALEREALREANNECVTKLRSDEETKWAQHAKVKHV
jgi:hypothetical protein